MYFGVGINEMVGGPLVATRRWKLLTLLSLVLLVGSVFGVRAPSATAAAERGHRISAFAEGDVDHDGLPNDSDFDSDNDGIPNDVEGNAVDVDPRPGSGRPGLEA